MAVTCLPTLPVQMSLTITGAGLLLLVLSIPQEVTSFSVGGRSARRAHDARSVDLAQALALLQRERRRVTDDEEFMTPDRLLGSRPFAAADVSDWLDKSRDNSLMLDGSDLEDYLGLDQEPAWVSDGNFKGFAPEAQAVKPSKEEIEDIFSSDEEPAGESGKVQTNLESGKSPKAERKLVKKSVPSQLMAADDDDGGLSLDTLTREEFKALMKAVGKLQRQVAAKDSDTTLTEKVSMQEEIGGSDPQKDIAIIQPASKEELQSLFAKGDDSLESSEIREDEEEGSSGLLPGSGLIIEEEVRTPGGGQRVLEVDTPQGGTRLTELDASDGQQEVVEETLPEESMGTLQDALEESERELSDALASQLERDISKEVIKEEIDAEQKEAEKEAEEAAAAEAVAAEVAAKVESQQQQQEDAVSAAKEEIARELGADDLATLEKMWMSRDDPLPPYAEKRTTKRAARNSLDERYSPATFRSRTIPDDITLERLLANSDIDDDDEDLDEDIIDSINEGVKEAALEREILNERDIKNALNAIKSENEAKEDIIYGSPLTGDEYLSPDGDDNDDDLDFDIPSSDQLPPTSSGGVQGSSRIDKERLRALANALSMDSEEDQEEDSDSLLADDDDMEPAVGTIAVEKVLNDLGFDLADTSSLPKEVSGLPPPLAQFVTRIVELQDEVGQLRVIAQLADLENDVLTDALNEATMAQPPGTVSDMEFESLQQAIWVEKELQKLKKGGSLDDLDLLNQALDSEASLNSAAVSKRGEPWRRKRVKVTTGADTALQTLPVSTLLRHSQRASKVDMEQLLGETYLRKGSVPDLADLGLTDTSIASIFLSDADQCPAVRQYSTNCELADLYSLPVDYEARALCNLHEMCYACGHSLHVPQASCDQVYRAAAKTLCRKGSACVLEAEIFLRTMKLKTRYVPHSQPTCRSTCAARFLGMI